MLDNDSSKKNLVKVLEVTVKKLATPIEKEINNNGEKRIIKIGCDIQSKRLESYTLYGT